FVIALILSNSPAFTRSPFTIQLPPHAKILSQLKYSFRFLALLPPVGMNFTMVYGAAIALIIATPPACSAGKNFTVFRPLFTACATSDGVMHPGNTGISLLMQ